MLQVYLMNVYNFQVFKVASVQLLQISKMFGTYEDFELLKVFKMTVSHYYECLT